MMIMGKIVSLWPPVLLSDGLMSDCIDKLSNGLEAF
jgi:hypothetical protein